MHAACENPDAPAHSWLTILVENLQRNVGVSEIPDGTMMLLRGFVLPMFWCAPLYILLTSILTLVGMLLEYFDDPWKAGILFGGAFVLYLYRCYSNMKARIAISHVGLSRALGWSTFAAMGGMLSAASGVTKSKLPVDQVLRGDFSGVKIVFGERDGELMIYCFVGFIVAATISGAVLIFDSNKRHSRT